MLGKYDVVHVQLFATVIKENNPASVVKNLMGLLSEFPQFSSTIRYCLAYKEDHST